MRASGLLLFSLVACDRPQPLLICHNANCTGPSVARDDSLAALSDSLALTYDGRFAYDGIEWDTFWDRAGHRCLFAHGLPHGDAVPASAAAQLIADHLATSPVPAWGGEFYTLIELKAQVGEAYSDFHTDEELALHAECALDMRDIIVAGSSAVTVGYLSSEPRLLKALTQSPRWQSQPIRQLLIADIFAPYSSVVPSLSDFDVPLQAVEFHPDFMTPARREAYRSLGLELMEWSFVTTPEMLDAIEKWEPGFVLTNEGILLRRWIED
ncbi:MAG TPA: hypothetical protein VLB44_17090 [Kofleriaceae bacterium]|nr:hypothetical protein [Kofleriaceae bacterium]